MDNKWVGSGTRVLQRCVWICYSTWAQDNRRALAQVRAVGVEQGQVQNVVWITWCAWQRIRSGKERKKKTKGLVSVTH